MELQVQCKVGDQVTKGQVLVVLEAMKMEYPIAAPADGKVHPSVLQYFLLLNTHPPRTH